MEDKLIYMHCINKVYLSQHSFIQYKLHNSILNWIVHEATISNFPSTISDHTVAIEGLQTNAVESELVFGYTISLRQLDICYFCFEVYM